MSDSKSTRVNLKPTPLEHAFELATLTVREGVIKYLDREKMGCRCAAKLNVSEKATLSSTPHLVDENGALSEWREC